MALTTSSVESRLKARATKSQTGGASLGVWPSKSDSILLRTETGDTFCPDHFIVCFACDVGGPELRRCKDAIEQIRPNEAFIEDATNARDLEASKKRRNAKTLGTTEILRWFHFVGPNIVEALGGVQHCLKTPVFRVERFVEGVLVQVTEERFDNANARHREVQMTAMRHLGLDKIEPERVPVVNIPPGVLLSSAAEVTEELWCAGADPRSLIERARQEYPITDRKLWLFTAACLRRLPAATTQKTEFMVDLLEKLADQQMMTKEVHDRTSGFALPEGTTSDTVEGAIAIILHNARELLHTPFKAAVATVNNANIAISRDRGIDTFEGRLAHRNQFGVVVRDIFRSPFRSPPAWERWRTPRAVEVAQHIYADRSFERLAELMSALQAAGCDDEEVLAHCRDARPHYRGCWVIDGLLGRE